MSESISIPPEAPVIAPVVPAPAPAVVEPVAAPAVAPAVEASAPAPTEAAPAPPTVIGEALTPPAPVAQPEAPAPAEPAQAEGQSDEPAPPPTYEPFKLPDGLTLEAERAGDFPSLLGQFESKTKADHAEVQAFGQQLIDRHIAEVQRAITEVRQADVDQREAQKVAWKDQFMSDPEIGGNRQQTTVDSAIQFIRTYGGTDEQQAELRELMNTSGVGNHPAMIRLLAKAGIGMAEGRPLAALAPAAPPKSNTQKMYGKAG